MNRGRSRQVSTSALARQASEERIMSPIPVKPAFAPLFLRTDSPSPPSSSTSMSPDYYDSPPSPPRSLEDQVHEAYALEDIHLAKILLLRLKGIEVTSDDDPRIAAVQDEDFDFCFMPNGPLLNEQDEKALKEIQNREMERIEELRRVERMRMCERKWIDEKQRLREQRIAEFRRRERTRLQEEEERQRQEEKRKLADEDRRRAAPLRNRKQVYSVNHLQRNRSMQDNQQPFVYDLMVPGPSSYPPRHSQPRVTPPPAPTHSRHIYHQPTFDDSAGVPFRDVLQSMQGQLFPPTADEEHQRRSRGETTPATSISRSRTQSQPRLKRRDMALMEALLEEVKYSEEERKSRKGKGKAQDCSSRRRSPACVACSSMSRSPLSSPSLADSSSSSSSSVSRTSSWLSFRSSSSSSSSLSSSTELTTPSTSPTKSSWFASRPRSWVSASTLTEAPGSICVSTPLRHSCRRGNSLTPISLCDGPLEMQVSSMSTTTTTHTTHAISFSYEGRRQRTSSTSSVQAAKDGAGLLVRRVSRFVELAKGFQNAYVTAALFSVAVSYEAFDEENARRSKATASTDVIARRLPATLKPSGSRASLKDVKLFLQREESTSVSGLCYSTTSPSDPLPEPKYIPLICPFPPTSFSTPPRTILPTPLPYQIHFKPIPKPSRSPFRCQAMGSDEGSNTECYPSASSLPSQPVLPTQITWRIRFVANPAYLRLKALQNIVWSAGGQWEGCARETALGGGRERVVGVAYEGVGRSALGSGIVLTA
ncbi:hypothetical protein CPB83DRAFT_848360 [Crepidotus variabilis]|uniref:Uncharacterized protein n=1 Tax=Crepidotus variabilis TaxID=179855 RepID=A0A9P6ENJ2_9AGAR|nr:hypothetical protein CPB83DRAFT_848360 [Crepidotus variabilis]